MNNFNESNVESATLVLLEALGYTTLSRPEIAPENRRLFSIIKTSCSPEMCM